MMTHERHKPNEPERMNAMNSQVSSILLGVNDMQRSKRFYSEGLGWKIQNDYKISVFFVPHGGSMVGFYGRDGLADMVGVSPDGSGFSGIVFTYVVRSEDRVDEILDEAKKSRREDPQARGEAEVGRIRRILRRPGWLHLEHRLQRRRKRPALRRITRDRWRKARRPRSTASGRDRCDPELLSREDAAKERGAN
jgi:catechol 2,3-dioxygenase-like lactoylglutathione lyase family enzyme